MRKRSIERGIARRSGECSDFVELARRMSIPPDVAIHEFIELGTHAPRGERAMRPAVRAGLASTER